MYISSGVFSRTVETAVYDDVKEFLFRGGSNACLRISSSDLTSSHGKMGREKEGR